MEKKRILMVEDCVSVALAIKHYFEDNGYLVDVASNVLEGMMRIAHYEYDAIILDYHFDCYNGKNVEDLTYKRNIPSVYFTASNDLKESEVHSPIIRKHDKNSISDLLAAVKKMAPLN